MAEQKLPDKAQENEMKREKVRVVPISILRSRSRRSLSRKQEPISTVSMPSMRPTPTETRLRFNAKRLKSICTSRHHI